MPAFWFETALLTEGWAHGVRLVVDDGVIASVTTSSACEPGDRRAAIAVPGMSNLHSHAFQRAMAGLAEGRGPADVDDFWSWREVMYRFVGHLTPDDIESISAQAYCEMLEAGFTRVGEFHYLHNDRGGARFAQPAEMSSRIAAAADASGIGLTLLPVFYAHSGFGGEAPLRRQARFTNDIDGFDRLFQDCSSIVSTLPDAVLGLAAHSLRAVTPDEINILLAISGARPFHIHVAEQSREVSDCLAWSGQRPVAWLLDHAEVNTGWCLVHATHIDETETARLATSGAVAGLCPITEANLGDGLFPAAGFLAAGGVFGVGTDSNVLIDLAEELRLLEYGQRLGTQGRVLLAARERPSVGANLFVGALTGGAQALGVRTCFEPGAPADFVTLDHEHPALAGKRGDAILDAWLFAARGGAVDEVWRRGERLVSQGRHVRGEAIAARYRRVLASVLAR